MNDKMLCLDGPLNGSYASPTEAESYGYEPDTWPTGEPVLIHVASQVELDEDAYAFEDAA